MKTKTRLITTLLILSCVFICAISITLIFAMSQNSMNVGFEIEYTPSADINKLNFVLNDDGDTYSVTTNTISITEAIIPQTYNGKPVTRIRENAFALCTSLTKVVIQNNITEIGYSAFDRCSGLTEITIPSSVKKIDDSAFSGCSHVTQITIMNGVTEIGDRAFQNLISLNTIKLPKSVSSIDGRAFAGSYNLTIEIDPANETLKCINNCIIEKNTGKLVLACYTNEIPADITEIGDYALWRYGYSSLIIPSSVVVIGAGACADSEDLTTLVIPNGVTSIGGGAFHNCTGLTEVTIPDSVTYIGSNAFADCTNLTSITFEHPSDWKYFAGADYTLDVSDAELAAVYLTSTYCFYNLERS